MRGIDIGIVLIYLLGTAIIPIIVAKRQKNKEDFMMAGRKMHWLPLALSEVAAGFSAVSLLGVPGFVLAHDMRYMPSLFLGLLSVPIIFFWIVPFLYKLQLISIYEFLGDRFCPGLRYFSSILFMVSKLGYLAMTIYTPALALNAITGVPILTLVIIMAILSAIYTMLGGMEGVIWSDVVQYIVMVIGLGGCVVFFLLGDTAGFWNIAVEAGKTKTLDFSFSFSTLNIWSLTISITLIGIAGTVSDQSSVQRMCSAKSLGDCLKSYVGSQLFGLPIVLILYFIGAWLFGFIQTTNCIPAEVAGTPDKIFPFFIAKQLPVGIAGLLLAAILAAGISTISCVLHSLTSLFMVDVYERFLVKEKIHDAKYVWLSRVVTVVWGILAAIVAMYVMYLGNTIIEVTGIIAGLVSAPLGGIFLLGIFTRLTNTAGAISGCVAGTIAAAVVTWLNSAEIVTINFLWPGIAGLVVTFVVGLLVSLIFRSKTEDKPVCEN